MCNLASPSMGWVLWIGALRRRHIELYGGTSDFAESPGKGTDSRGFSVLLAGSDRVEDQINGPQ